MYPIEMIYNQKEVNMNILFVCHANLDRSPTAEQIYANRPGLEVKSAGVGWYAQQPVTAALLQWADAVLCMEEEHKKYIVEDFESVISGKVIDSLDVEDIHPCMHPKLVKIITEKVDAWLSKHRPENKSRPTIVFGDIHGSTYWKKVVNENPDCRYIFLGDYLDPYENIDGKQLINNLEEIIQLKKDRHDDVVLLLGNHDLHYFCHDVNWKCTRFDGWVKRMASPLFMENRHLFVYAFQEDKRIFTHAGISQQWFLNDFKGDAHQNIACQLNNPLPKQKPALYRCGDVRGGDRFAKGGIFWADISELDDPLQGYTQFAGHNRVADILEHSSNDGKITFCDCLFNEKYLRLI